VSYSPKYISADDLANALSPTVFLEIFDDDNTNDIAAVKASDQVLLVIENAEGEVESRIGVEYNLDNVTGSDRLVRRACLEYAIAYSLERHPEVTRSAQAPERFKRAENRVQLLQDAILELVDSPTQKPANVGGALYDPTPTMWTDTTTGDYTGGDF
jgi:hypothetical protein